MKKLAICGDSWMTPTLNYPDTHFSEIIAKHYNAELLALSRSGCSNGAICLQIEESIKRNADFVIIGSTTPDRIEIPLPENRISKIYLKSWKIFSKSKNSGKYKKNRGIANISYSKHPDLSTKNNFMVNPVLISESINNLIWQEEGLNSFYSLDSKIVKSLVDYTLNLYDPNFKRQTDCWCISNSLRKLQDNNINFLFFPNKLITEEFVEDISWLDKKYIANIDGPYNLEGGDARYHTSEKAQIYVAEQLINIINERFSVI
jgi:hypothetical protein